jgi:hypothetical protein
MTRSLKRWLFLGCLLLACTQPPAASAADTLRHTIPAWPIVYYRTEGDVEKSDILFSLIYYERQKSRTRYELRLFLSSTEGDPEKDYRKTTLLLGLSTYTRTGPNLKFHLFPLYWYGRTPTSTYNRFFPLYWYEHTPTSQYRFIVPLYWSQSSPETHHTVLFPLYWQGGDSQHSYLYLWPLFGVDRRGDEFVRYSTLYPLFQYSLDRKRDETTINAFWPLYRLQFSPQGVSHYLLPLYWYRYGAGHSTGLVLSYYWNREPNRTSQAFLPLWYRLRGERESTDLLLPLYLSHAEGDARFLMVTPFYLQQTTPTSQLRIAFPVYLDAINGESRFQMITPLYLQQSTPTSGLRIVLPLYLSRFEENSTFRMITPLYYQSRSVDSRFDLLLPLFARYHAPNSSLLFIAPSWLSTADEHSHFSMLLPLFLQSHADDGSRFFLSPLYISSITPHNSTHMVLPVYYDFRSDQSATRMILPLYLSVRSEQNHLQLITPLFFHYRTADSLLQLGLPLYLHYAAGPSSFTTLFPLYFHSRDDTQHSSTTYYFPVYGHYQRGDTVSRHFLLFPIYSQLRDEGLELRAWDLLWPLWHYETTPTTSAFRFLPLVWHTRTPDSSTTIGFPLYWSFATGDQRSWYLFPIYGARTRGDWYARRFILGPTIMQTRDDRTDYRRWDFLFGLSSFMRQGATTRDWIFPLYYHRQDAASRTTIGFPLYWSFREGDRLSFHLIPLYGARSIGDRYTRRYVLGPLFIHTHDADRSLSRIDLLFPLVRWETGKDSASAWFLPLFYHRRDPTAETTIGFPLYWSFRKGDRLSFHLIPFFGVTTVGDRYSRRYVLGPLFIQTHDADRSLSRIDLLFPLVRWETGKDSASAWFLPLFYHRRDPASETTIGFPLYWSFRDGDRLSFHLIPFYGVTTIGDRYTRRYVLGPLFIQTHDADRSLSRIDLLFPLIRWETGKDSASAWFLPLFYHRRDPASEATIGFPLYWSLASGNDSSVVVFPIYAQFQHGSYREYAPLWPLFRFGGDPETGTTLVQALLYYHRQQEDNSVTTLFPFWWHISTPRVTKDTALLFHQYEHDNDTQTSRLSLLGIGPLSLAQFEWSPTVHKQMIFPIYQYEHNDQTDQLNWSLLWLVFSYSSRGDMAQKSAFLWQLFTYERKDAQTTDARLFYLFMRHKKTATSSLFEINPFFHIETDKEKGSYWAILGGFIGRETTPDGHSRMQWLWVL